MAFVSRFRIVLSVISGEMTVAEAARRGKASEQSISTWKRQFLEGGPFLGWKVGSMLALAWLGLVGAACFGVCARRGPPFT